MLPAVCGPQQSVDPSGQMPLGGLMLSPVVLCPGGLECWGQSSSAAFTVELGDRAPSLTKEAYTERAEAGPYRKSLVFKIHMVLSINSSSSMVGKRSSLCYKAGVVLKLFSTFAPQWEPKAPSKVPQQSAGH
ncbi:unnamed protein product [Arctogadus glacialis]